MLNILSRSVGDNLRYTAEKFIDRINGTFSKLSKDIHSTKNLLSGNVAIGEAALDANLINYFGYPITPATPIMEYLAGHLPEKGGKVVPESSGRCSESE